MQRIRAGNRIATYTWLADGTKLQVADSTGRGYVYLGSLVYAKDGDNLTLESTGFGGGRITASEGPDGMGYATNYQITDHLGSVRVVFESRKNVLARNDYYAFGKKHLNSGLLNATGDINRWHFNGKEWQTTANVGFLDYGARMYDQEIGIWFVIDPLAEKFYPYGPYVYVGNNPVRIIDIDGKDWLEATGKTLTWYGGEVGNKEVVVSTYSTVSGKKGYQRSGYQALRNIGPTVEGHYSINLSASPDRQATGVMVQSGEAALIRNPEGGVEKVGVSPVMNNEGKGLYADFTELWGNYRAKLDPVEVPHTGNRDIQSFYIHDSQKGETGGCIEISPQFFKDLIDYIQNNMNINIIDVIVKYENY